MLHIHSKVSWLITLFFTFFACGCNNTAIDSSLQQFDHSLDSLITDPIYYTRSFALLGEDTLFKDPQQIDQTCYIRLGRDSLLVEANSNIFKFRNRQLIYRSTKTVTGKKIVHVNVYFQKEINNPEINSLRELYKSSDTLIFGNLVAFNKEGRVIKSILSAQDDYRKLEITRYDEKSREKTFWRREYMGKKYDPENLSKTKVTRVEYEYVNGYSIPANKTYVNNQFISAKEARNPETSADYYLKQDNGEMVKKTVAIDKWYYVYDQHGNWIMKEDGKGENSTVFYRKITYNQ